jgi:CRISPR-associated protein Cas1
MQLIINTYGSYLQKNGDCFKVKADDKVFEVSCKKVSSILISTSAYITTDAIKMAIENNIDIVFIDDFGNPYGRVWHPKLGSTVLIRRRQLEKGNCLDGVELAKKWISIKLQNQKEFITRLRKNREDLKNELTEKINIIDLSIEAISKLSADNIDEVRNKIMTIEASGSKAYFEALSICMPEGYKFSKRSRDPAEDYFNAMLNYSYGILYSIVEKACIIAGLDPYIGFLHSDNYNKKSLVFDIIEMYRIFGDEVVTYLFTRRQVKNEFFDPVPGGFSLNKEGKAFLIENFNNFMNEPIKYKGRMIKRINIIQLDMHELANSFIKEEG